MTDLHDAFDAHIKAQKEQRSGADGAPLARRAPAPLPEDALAPITEDDEAAAQKEATIQELQDANIELQVGTSTFSLQFMVCEASEGGHRVRATGLCPGTTDLLIERFSRYGCLQPDRCCAAAGGERSQLRSWSWFQGRV